MNTLKKTLVLSNKDSQKNSLAILSLYIKNGNIFGSLKVYNLNEKSDLILGIKNEEQIFKQNIILNNNSCDFLCQKDFDLDKNIGCVLLKSENNNFTPILWGCERSDNYKSQIVQNLKSSVQKIQSMTKSILPSETLLKENMSENISRDDNYSNENIEPMEENIEDSIKEIKDVETLKTELNATNDLSIQEDYATHPIKNKNYLNTFSGYDLLDQNNYSQISMEDELNSEELATSISALSNNTRLFENTDTEIEKEIDRGMIENEQSQRFYLMIAEQLDDLFDKYPKEENLERLVENSHWAKIKYEDSDKYYVVGLIYLDNSVKYICYGVPGNYNIEPPIELRGYSQWLPVDTRNPYDNGYWVMYQDADTGENVYMN